MSKAYTCTFAEGYEYMRDWKSMRFSRSSGHRCTYEAVVMDIQEKKQGSLLDGVHLEFLSVSAPPLLHMGDLLVLQSMDGHHEWEAEVKLHGDVMCFVYGNDNDHKNLQTMIIWLRDGNGGECKLLRDCNQIVVFPEQSLTSHSTDNVTGVDSKKISKARPDEAQNRAKAKIKIGIDGYGSIARTMIKIALDCQDLELVAINDPLLISADHETCMFRHQIRNQEWRSDYKMKDANTLIFNDKEVTLFRFRFGERREIPWNKTGAEYIVEVCKYDNDTDKEEVRTSKPEHYSPDTHPLKNCLYPLAKVPHENFGMANDVNAAIRFPVLIRVKPLSDPAALAIGEVYPLWKGGLSRLMFKIPTDIPPINVGIAIELARWLDYNLIRSNKRPSDVFNILFGWCVEVTRQTPEVMYCELNFK